MPAFLLYDALYAILATGLYGAAGTAGYEVAVRLPLPPALAALAGIVVGLVALVALVGLCTALCPRLEPGRHPMFRGRVFFAWVVRSILRRVLWAPPLKTVYFNSYMLRWLSLRALGADVAFSSNMSNDVELIDPALLRVERGAMIGTRALVSGHYIADGLLVLAPVVIGEGALVSGEAVVGPGVTIGRGAKLLGRCGINQHASIGEGAVVGADAYVAAEAVVAPGERVPNFSARRREEAR